MHSDEQFAAALNLARKCKVIVVQNRNGGIRCFAKRPPGKPRGPEVGGIEINRRLKALQRKQANAAR